MKIFLFFLLVIAFIVPFSVTKELPGEPLIRQKRYYIVTEHANQVLRAVEQYKKQREGERAQ
ncbi:unnamed protein product [Caenorhabditis brenneri]